MHPGDVRKFKAIDVPALHHIKDCIVFPQKGPRPHPDEMAGSDLDGDEYTVIWKRDLIFQKENYPAMHFPCTEEKTLDRNIRLDDILEFYCTFIQGYCVGLIANAHLAMADFLPDGIFNEKCLKVANKYATALDFPKTAENDFKL